VRFRLFGNKDNGDRVVVETVRPVEIPVITTVKQCLVRGVYGEAVRYGYQAAMYDLQRAYRTVFPPTWTNKDILEKGFHGRKGYLPQLFAQLYELYEPVRFGPPSEWKMHYGDVVGILQSIYADEALWRLYTSQVGSPSYGPADGNGKLTPAEVRIRDSHLYVKRATAESPPGIGEVRLVQSALYVQHKDKPIEPSTNGSG
jgi:metal-sulfur cluster biosynthetic enzyme